MKIEEYVQIGNALKDIREILYKYPHIQGKTSPFEKRRAKADNAIGELMCNLEDMMFLECSEELIKLDKEIGPFPHPNIDTLIFYGGDRRINLAKMEVEVKTGRALNEEEAELFKNLLEGNIKKQKGGDCNG